MAIQEALEEENTKNTPSFGTEELEVIHRSSTEAGLLGIHNFAQKAIGAFRFSAALIEWSQSELESLQKSGYKRIKTRGTYHGQAQTLCTPSQLQRVAMSAPCRQEYSRRPCCSMLTNACGMKKLLKKLC